MAGLIFLWQQPGGTPPPPPPPAGGDDGYHRHYRSGERRRRGLDFDKPRDDIEDRLRRAYARIMGEEPTAPAVAAVAAAVAPHVAIASDARLPPPEAIDWTGLARDLHAVAVLVQQAQSALDDEELALFMLLL